MAHYRKIDTRIWNDEKFRDLSDSGKLAFFFLLTHPNMTSIGAMRATVPGLGAEKGWNTKAFQEAFGEALAKGMAKHDEKACVVWLPNFIRYNPPESPNVLKAWGAAIELLPECALTNQAIHAVKGFAEGLTEGFAKALPEAFSKAMPNQEQEQEQKQEVKPVTRASRLPTDWKLPSDWKAWALAQKPKWNDAWVLQTADAFRDYWVSSPKGTKLDWEATWRNWVRRSEDPKFKPAADDPWKGAK